MKIKEHFTLKTTMYDIIMFRQTISVNHFCKLLTRNTFIYTLHTYSSHAVLVAQDSIEGIYNAVHQYNISITSVVTIEMRAFL